MHNLWDKFWRDDEGNVVIWQFPNAWLIGWVVATFISLFFNGRTADVLTTIGSVSLIVWSVLEVWRGADYFRRLLGLVVLVFSIASLIKSF